MLSLPPAVRIFVARGAVDLRKSFDALAAVVREVLRHDPLSGHLFVFVNRRRDRLNPRSVRQRRRALRTRGRRHRPLTVD